MLIVDILVEAGCEVDEASNAKEALLKSNGIGAGFDAALIDLGLPDEPGDRLIAKLRETRPDFPVLLATGLANSALYEAFAGDKKLQIVAKPFNQASLKSALQALGIPTQ